MGEDRVIGAIAVPAPLPLVNEAPLRGLHPDGRVSTIAAQTPEPFAFRDNPESTDPSQSALLYLGDSIPDLPTLIVGTRISGSEAENLGYREFAKYGGWLIWNAGDDFYVIDCAEPRAWTPLAPIEAALAKAGAA